MGADVRERKPAPTSTDALRGGRRRTGPPNSEPEARFALAEAALYLALAPKSNSVTAALGRAADAVRSLGNAPVPAHLRDAHYRGAKRLGHGTGYRYPHDDPRGWVEQRYLPEGLERGDVYRPSSHGVEPELGGWKDEPDRG